MRDISNDARSERELAASRDEIILGPNKFIHLVQIPSGTFSMGSPASERGRSEDEVRHEVTISTPFLLSSTKITVAQFAVFVSESRYKTDAERIGYAVGLDLFDSDQATYQANGAFWHKPGFEQTDDDPVVDVSWNDAMVFCQWLSQKTGRSVVLPTSAQWEYACRAGIFTTYPWGNDPDNGGGRANCFDQTLASKLINPSIIPSFIRGRVRTPFSWNDGYAYTSPAKTFTPNSWGLYEMTGNASEWCRDRYGEVDSEPVVDPTGWSDQIATQAPDKGIDRIYRGGSWDDGPRRARIALCRSAPMDHSDNALGFRIEVLLDSTEP
jgi:formylglycine-generating enzyme required for sulfatase activity